MPSHKADNCRADKTVFWCNGMFITCITASVGNSSLSMNLFQKYQSCLVWKNVRGCHKLYNYYYVWGAWKKEQINDSCVTAIWDSETKASVFFGWFICKCSLTTDGNIIRFTNWVFKIQIKIMRPEIVENIDISNYLSSYVVDAGQVRKDHGFEYRPCTIFWCSPSIFMEINKMTISTC